VNKVLVAPGRAAIAVARACVTATLALLTACASVPVDNFVSSPWPAPYDAAAEPLVVGDQIQIDLYPSARLDERTYTIGVEDRLRLDVADHPQMTREQMLALPDGSISVPEIGRVLVVGKTLDQVSAEIVAGLRRAHFRDPRVTLSVQESDTRLRSLLNHLANRSSVDADIVQIPDNGTLSLPYLPQFAALKPVDVLRDDITKAYRQVFGNRIEVAVKLRQARPRQIFVFGEVTHPGPIDFTPKLSSMAAVAAAGGPTLAGATSQLVIYRALPDGRHAAWRIDLQGQLAAPAEAQAWVSLMPNDVIYVPKSGVALVNDAIEQYIRRMLPLPANIGISVNTR
jgi:protein involved in polysaccharide export with SLBB domain